MPDTRFSWASLKEHIRKFGFIYIIGLVACALLTNLLWTTTRPRIPGDQQILIYLADSFTNPDPLNAMAPGLLERVRGTDERVLAIEFQSLQYSRPEDDYTGAMVLMTRLATAEGDAFLASAGCMEALLQSQVLMPLDDAVAGGWMQGLNLEPYYATLEDEDSGAKTTILAGLKLDRVNRLTELGAMYNEGAVLAIPAFTENPESTMAALELLFTDLMEAGDA